MRVLFFIDSLNSGGAQRQAVEIACALHRAKAVEASFAIYHDLNFFGPRLEREGIPIILLRKRWRFDPGLPRRLRETLRVEHPTILHAFLPHSCLYAFLAVRGLGRNERPILRKSVV